MKEKKRGWVMQADLEKTKSGSYRVKNAIIELASQNPREGI